VPRFVRAGLAIIVGLALSFGAYFLGASSGNQGLDEVETETVYVFSLGADSGLSFGRLLEEGVLTLQTFPVTALPSDALTVGAEPPEESVLSAPKKAGEIATSLVFQTEGQLDDQTGIRATDYLVSIGLSADQAVAKRLRAGDRVVIFATGEAEGGAGTATRTIIPEARVAYVGGDGDVDSSSTTVSVTLALSPQDAQTLVHYSNTATLHLGLVAAQNSGEALTPIIGFGAVD
jgi:Flp pilus assembly protein CpaB